MFYRRKIVLALLQIFGGQLDKLRLQKLTFLATQRQENPIYDFLPYKYGCFSYSLAADLSAMVKHRQLSDIGEGYEKADAIDYLKEIRQDDRKRLSSVKAAFGQFSNDDLMRYTYRKYPFYAINSVKASKLLGEAEYQNVLSARPRRDDTVLFTIGYEGISLERYLTRLIQHDVRMLVDVRRNPMSMKFGFSKQQLKTVCEKLDIAYLHIPEVGIASDKRQELNSQSDYDKLFAEYKGSHLPDKLEHQDRILELLNVHRRIALTCFEANICQCHRKPLAESISIRPGFRYRIQHL